MQKGLGHRYKTRTVSYIYDLGDLVDGENQLLSVTDGWDSESFGTFLFYNE